MQRVDDPEAINRTRDLHFTVPVLQADSQAWALVRNGTQSHHRAARWLLREFSPAELGAITLWAAS